MKRLFTILMAICLLSPVYSQNYNKAIEKAQKKEVKEK